jgi:cysteine desulfurase
MNKVIYLDYAATTPVDPRVAQKMSDCLLTAGNFGNPASRSHIFGWRAEEAVEEARAQVAELFNADPREIVWTSGATESDNLALKGVAEFYGADTGRQAPRRHIITSAIEHKAVLDTCEYLASRGFRITYLEPGSDGRIQPRQVAEAIEPDTLLASIMHVNNEIGVVNDIAGIGAVCREKGIFYHVDAAQGAGKLPIDVQSLPIDLMSVSAHKMYGPKGVGILYVRRQPQVRLVPQMHGGGHERGMRSGTLPTHQIVGMGEAARLMREHMASESARITALRDRLCNALLDLGGVMLNGAPEARVCGILNLSFAGVDGETLLLALDDIAVSTGSACTSETVEPSYVLRALGVPDELAHASLRLSLGRFTTDAEVDHAISRIRDVVSRLRQASVVTAGSS